MSIISYFSPISNQHRALDNFKKLNKVDKVVAIALSALAGLLTFPLLGVGGVCVFRLWVDYRIKKIEAARNEERIDNAFIEAFGNTKVETTAAIKQIKESFSNFFQELESEIFPLYEKHEKGFDRWHRMHGRMHIGRAVIFCEVMARYHHLKGNHVDFDLARRVTGLHDAGREGNGEDVWEKESADLLCKYKKSRMIIKNGAQSALEFEVFQSADCLDIMRPCTGRGGKKGFKKELLSFLKGSNRSDDVKFREKLIQEAWDFIQLTESKKFKMNDSKGFMKELLNTIKDNSEKFTILSTLL